MIVTVTVVVEHPRLGSSTGCCSTIPNSSQHFEAGGGVRWYTLGQSVSQSRLSFFRNNEKRWTPYVSRIWQLVAVFFFQIKFSVRIPY